MKNISNKTIGGIILVLLLVLGGYFIYNDSASNIDSAAPLTTTEPIGGGSSPEVVQQLNRLRSITLNTDFFDTAEFRSLTDFSIQINPQPVGRDNPFAPTDFVPSGEVITPTQEEYSQNQSSAPGGQENSQATSSSTSTPENTGTSTPQ